MTTGFSTQTELKTRTEGTRDRGPAVILSARSISEQHQQFVRLRVQWTNHSIRNPHLNEQKRID